MANRPQMPRLPRRPRLLVPVVVALVVLFIIISSLTGLYTDLLWYRSVGFSRVFSSVLLTKILLFLIFGAAMAVIIGANVALAHRLRPPFRTMSPEQQNLERYRVAIEPRLRVLLAGICAVFGLFAGLSAAARWQTWLLWRNGTSFGAKDAQFHRDVSFYAFDYPFYRWILGFLFGAVVLSLLVSTVTHYLFGGLRVQTPGEKIGPAARAHLSVLLGLFVLLKAVAYFLDRYGLAFSPRGVVTGPSYTDVNAVLPAKTILAIVALICAGLFFANVVARNFALPAISFVLLVVVAIGIGGIYPAAIQQFRVKPNEVQRESRYIGRNIDATRAAYQLNTSQVTQYDAKVTPAQVGADLNRNGGQALNARLLDPNILTPTFKQLQQIRAYFNFPDSLDIDRYDLGTGPTDYVVGVRELDLSGLGSTQRNWINDHLIYTHGNGFVAAAAGQVDPGGRPVFTVRDIPTTGPLNISQPRIYFGELSPQYSVVNTRQREIDGPGGSGGEQATYTYEGTGGVQLSSPLRKLLYAVQFREKNLLLSGAITKDSRIQYIRNPRDRVQKVAPFLTLDGDPYPAVVDGRVQWILDGYTTSSGYPYSQLRPLGDVTADAVTSANRARQPQDQVNYIRNSVKATVDAYDGTVRLYTFDDNDPVLTTWKKAFPGVVLPASDISADLRAHFRYPEDLFKVQRDLLTKYHVTDPAAFYNQEDFWTIPSDPTVAQGRAAADQPPYYLFLQVPGASKPGFVLTTSFVARNRPNLAAFASVSSDPADYGTIRILRLPRDTTINGPGTIAGNFESNTAVSTTLSLLRQGGSNVILGNLLTLPVAGGLLYVEPVYVQASGGESYPLLRKVLVGYGDQVAFEDTLQQALDKLFGQGAITTTSGGAGAAPPSASASPAPGAPAPAPSAAPSTPGSPLQQAITDANQAFLDGQDALRRSDFAAYGAAQQRLSDALKRAAAAGSAGTSSGAPTSPAVGTPAPAPSP